MTAVSTTQAGAGPTEADSPEEFDPVLVMVMSAMMRFPVVLSAVRKLGPDLFPAGAARALAASLVTGTTPDLSLLTRRERTRFSALRERAAREVLPNTEEWGLDLVRLQTERNFCTLLASMLEWAAGEIRAGRPVAWVRRLLVRAFDSAE